MRSFCLILFLTAVFASAQPGTMLIHLKDSTTDSIICSRLDRDVGITFRDNNLTMNIGIADLVDTTFSVYSKYIISYCTCQIDSITFINVPPAAAKRQAIGNLQVSRAFLKKR